MKEPETIRVSWCNPAGIQVQKVSYLPVEQGHMKCLGTSRIKKPLYIPPGFLRSFTKPVSLFEAQGVH
jgi:hypothetical protein